MRWLLLISLIIGTALAQQQPERTPDGKYRVPKNRRDGRPLFWSSSTFTVKPAYEKLTKKQKRQMELSIKRANKLRRNVRRVYPLAKFSARLLKETNSALSTMPNEKERKRYVKELEKELKDRFEGEIRSLTLKQGKILIKLIHRETNNSAYELIKNYRSGATAFFWQTIATFFGANLKKGFFPKSDVEDAQIEYIVREIESGVDVHYY